MLLGDEREAVVEACRAMLRDDLTVGTSGNVSVRVGELVAITASGVDYRGMTAHDVVVVDPAGRVVEGRGAPSSEWPMHRAVYAGSDAAAVVHTHPVHATAVGLLVDEVPLVHYMLGACGGSVPVIPYVEFGSSALADAVAAVLPGRNAVVMRNHGATTWGTSLGAAYTSSLYLEWACRVWLAAKAVGEPAVLTSEQFAAVGARVAAYARPHEGVPGVGRGA